jgi:hypothetical protein
MIDGNARVEAIKAKALQEIDEEDFREAVRQYKVKLRTKKSLWDRIFPWKLVIIRKESLNGR